jgi:hypothetical protein
VELKWLFGEAPQKGIKAGVVSLKMDIFDTVTKGLQMLEIAYIFIRFNKTHHCKGMALGELFDEMIGSNPVASMWRIWTSEA